MSAQAHQVSQSKPLFKQWQSIQAISPVSVANSNNNVVSDQVRQQLAVCLLEHIRTTTPFHRSFMDTPVLTVFSSDTKDWIATETQASTSLHSAAITPANITLATSTAQETNIHNRHSDNNNDPWQLVQSIVWALTLTGMILLLGPSLLASAIGDSLGSVQFY